jgi:hypothetical protein
LEVAQRLSESADFAGNEIDTYGGHCETLLTAFVG